MITLLVVTDHVQRRLDWLKTTGLDIMMTEWDLGWNNVIERADIYEDNIRAFFAHPALLGVLNWYMWEGVQENQVDLEFAHYLVEGPDRDNLTVCLDTIHILFEIHLDVTVKSIKDIQKL